MNTIIQTFIRFEYSMFFYNPSKKKKKTFKLLEIY